jgi:hypothetical protein
MLIMYLCVRGTDVGHIFVCWRYRCWSCISVVGISMLVMYLFLTHEYTTNIDTPNTQVHDQHGYPQHTNTQIHDQHRYPNTSYVFVCCGYRCWSCICVLRVSMLLMYLCVGVSMLVMYLCVRGIHVSNVFVCLVYRC